jgi:NADPH:quinone reductase-like Zn-dependent oxidoreductase
MNKERGTILDDIAGLLAAGTVTPCIDRTYPLADAPEAMRQLEAGTVRGKLAISI